MASRLSQPWATLPRQASAEAKAGGHELPLQTSLLPLFSANTSQGFDLLR